MKIDLMDEDLEERHERDRERDFGGGKIKISG